MATLHRFRLYLAPIRTTAEPDIALLPTLVLHLNLLDEV